MKIRICTIGKDRRGEFEGAIQRYQKQLPWAVEILEKDPKKPNAPTSQRMQEEATLLREMASGSSIWVAMDERGKAMSSPQLANMLQRYQDEGSREIAFLIGGADGLLPELRKECSLVVSLGTMVWPHQMVRLMLMEQLYRSYSINTGHPYHRA